MMRIKGQQIGLQVRDKKTNEERLIQTYHGNRWACKTYSSTSNTDKIYTIVNSTFAELSDYEFYIKKKIMKKFRLKYTQDNTVKGSIAIIIIICECEIAKVMNKWAEKTHHNNISKTRCNKEEREKKCQLKKKKKKNSDRINNEWHNNDGSVYNEMTRRTSKSDDAIFYVKKLKCQRSNWKWRRR